jgi:hypothetical protein
LLAALAIDTKARPWVWNGLHGHEQEVFRQRKTRPKPGGDDTSPGTGVSSLQGSELRACCL